MRGSSTALASAAVLGSWVLPLGYGAAAAQETTLTARGFVDAIVERRKIATSEYRTVVSPEDIELYDFFEKCTNTDFVDKGSAVVAIFDCRWNDRQFGFGVAIKLENDEVHDIDVLVAGEIKPEATEDD